MKLNKKEFKRFIKFNAHDRSLVYLIKKELLNIYTNEKLSLYDTNNNYVTFNLNVSKTKLSINIINYLKSLKEIKLKKNDIFLDKIVDDVINTVSNTKQYTGIDLSISSEEDIITYYLSDKFLNIIETIHFLHPEYTKYDINIFCLVNDIYCYFEMGYVPDIEDFT